MAKKSAKKQKPVGSDKADAPGKEEPAAVAEEEEGSQSWLMGSTASFLRIIFVIMFLNYCQRVGITKQAYDFFSGTILGDDSAE